VSEPSTATISELVQRLLGDDAATRATAAEQLCRAGEAAADAAVPLVRACGDPEPQVRDWAVAALEELGAPPVNALDELMELAASNHPLVAYWAITLLGRSGQAAAAAVRMLAERLGPASDPAVAQRAAWALGKIGPAAASAAGSLRTAADSDDPRLARLAQEALSAISG
jgi:HEAT repeat protein